MLHQQLYQQHNFSLNVNDENAQHASRFDKHMAFIKTTLQSIKSNDIDKFMQKSEFTAELTSALQFDKKLTAVLVLACCELDRKSILEALLSLNSGYSSTTRTVNFANPCPSASASSCLININCTNEDGISGLMIAVKKGNIDVVRLLLRINGLKVQATDNYGWTALMYGCYYGNIECVKLLLAAGAWVNIFDNDHISCLIWAAGRGHNGVVQLLLDYGAKVNAADKYGTTPLIWACRKGYTEVAKTLLNAGASINATGMFGWSALLTASRDGYLDTTKVLLERKDINVNTCDAQRLSPLMIASKEGFVEIVQILINKGAFVNLSDRYGHTALIRAVRGGHIRIVEALINANADIDHIGFDKRTALFWSVEKGYVDIVRVLLRAKPNLEIATSDGETCLIRAVKLHRTDVVKLLLDSGAQVFVTDKFGDSVLHMAVRSQSKSIVELILSASQKNWSLVYKANKRKETPFSLDQANSTQLFPKLFDELEQRQRHEQMLRSKSPISLNEGSSSGVTESMASSSIMARSESVEAIIGGQRQQHSRSGNGLKHSTSPLRASFSSLSKFLSHYQLSVSPALSKKQLKKQQKLSVSSIASSDSALNASNMPSLVWAPNPMSGAHIA